MQIASLCFCCHLLKFGWILRHSVCNVCVALLNLWKLSSLEVEHINISNKDSLEHNVNRTASIGPVNMLFLEATTFPRGRTKWLVQKRRHSVCTSALCAEEHQRWLSRYQASKCALHCMLMCKSSRKRALPPLGPFMMWVWSFPSPSVLFTSQKCQLSFKLTSLNPWGIKSIKKQLAHFLIRGLFYLTLCSALELLHLYTYCIMILQENIFF